MVGRLGGRMSEVSFPASEIQPTRKIKKVEFDFKFGFQFFFNGMLRFCIRAWYCRCWHDWKNGFREVIVLGELWRAFLAGLWTDT